jgi:hypothetical protein
MRPDGLLYATWFLFDKRAFPMMQPFQNTLYINRADPTNAVIYDRAWLLKALEATGLVLVDAQPPEMRGFHWYLAIAKKHPGVEPVELPSDEAPYGSMPSPLLP